MLKMFSKTAFFSLSFLVQHVFLPSKWNTLLSAHLSFWILPPVVNRNLRIDKESTQNVFKGRASFYSKLWTVIDEFWFEPKIYLLLLLLHSDFCSTVTAALWRNSKIHNCRKHMHLEKNMSKRLWTETRQFGATNPTQKTSWAKLSQAEPSWS